MIYGTWREAIKIIFNKVTTDDWDEVICITGKNRRGKSNLGMHLVDEWLKLLKGKVEEEDTDKHIGIDAYSFAKVFSNVKKFEPAVHDEAGDISNRATMSKTNKLYAQAYQIVAGENLLTILILPELWDLDTYFRKQRIRHLINVYRRGGFDFWTNVRYDKMIKLNATKIVKDYYVVKPAMRGTFGKYNGVLKKRYDEMKNKKLSSVRENLLDDLSGFLKDKKQDKKDAVLAMFSKDVPQVKIAKLMGISTRTVSRYIKEMTT